VSIESAPPPSSEDTSTTALPRTRRVAIGGSPYFGRKLASLLSGDGWRAAYLETRGWRPDAALSALLSARRADVVYHLGGQIERFSRPHLLAMAARRPCVMHWTGSDVLYARDVVARGAVTEQLRRGCVHWAGAPWLVDELAAIGVDAMWMPHSTVDAPPAVPPLPAEFTVLTYLRPGREAFYGAGIVRRVATALPAARVLVAGVDELTEAPPNLSCLGWVTDMPALYARSHVLLRMPAHDGLAFMVQEALAYGRYAVWNHPFPSAIEALTAEEAVAAVADLAERHTAGRLPPNLLGAAQVRKESNPARIRDALRHGLLAAVEARG
jgi:hypothetical protein